MAIGDFSNEFSSDVTTSTFERGEGGSSQVTINLQFRGSLFPQADGTLKLSVPVPGATAGPASFTGVGFLDGGETVGLTAEGSWEQVPGELRWRIRGINMSSAGQVLLSDGTLDLASRSYNGTVAEWT